MVALWETEESEVIEKRFTGRVQETVIAYTRTDSEAAEERVVDAALATQAASQDQDMDAVTGSTGRANGPGAGPGPGDGAGGGPGKSSPAVTAPLSVVLGQADFM